jgi:hypothetical protein
MAMAICYVAVPPIGRKTICRIKSGGKNFLYCR